MSITTNKVNKSKVNGVYQAYDVDLKINLNNPSQHNVIITSINKKRKTARVKTITSLEKKVGNQYKFKNGKLSDVKRGNILVIPRIQLKTKYLSGVNHNGITISLNKLYYKEPNDRTCFPNRYHKLIHKK